MVGFKHSRGLITLGLSFCTLLITHDMVLATGAKGKKDKKVAVVSPTIKEKSPELGNANSAANKQLQSELESENALNRARLEKQLSAIIAQIERLRVEKELQRLGKEVADENARRSHEKAMLLLNMEKEKLTMELELAKARFMQQMESYDSELIKLSKKIELEKGQTQLLQETTHRVQAEIEALKAKAVRNNHIAKRPIYLKDPLVKRTNTLVLSDRCIELNGYIIPWKANYIVDQINYFNNKNSDHPIFIIIGSSPGGCISAGWNILQAIEHSKAPVYVIVKECAASMAALITTLATKSYAYPNAMILHHQPWSCVWGNLRETKEHYESLKEIWKRLGGRVAKKMGISLKEFDKKLYQKSMCGDWKEYGDSAKKLKWVDYVISGIQNSAVSMLPDAADYTFEKFIKQYYGFDATKGKDQLAEEQYYQSIAPHDFDYSYRPDRKAQMMRKK
ncbi:ATP-dependent Clp protease proteolytic subunit [Cardinium endosymbiont of Nabis limbatus]|uniref:ATP-dependent Clp protease proteolytic subunit n=1 Tax=Cardinium endosymbiont of Nabis limbatus TaxID=3066217 RepID=UPI003AF33976